MKNKKGFTLVELIVSFVLITVVSLALFKTVLSLQQKQQINISKNNYKAFILILNNNIQKDFLNDNIITVMSCGTNCYDIVYENKGSVRLSIDNTNNIIEYGDIKEKLPSDYKFIADIEFTSYINNLDGYNSFILLTIPVKSNYESNIDNIKYMYQYDSKVKEIELDSEVVTGNNCIFSGNLVKGAEYVNGQYTYRYMEELTVGGAFNDLAVKGWGVYLTDKSSTSAVTSELCTHINSKPVVSMSAAFSDSLANAIDLRTFDASNVLNMNGMFYNTNALVGYARTSLELSRFNDSSITNIPSTLKFEVAS